MSLALCAGTAARAEDGQDPEVQALKQQVHDLQRRIDAIAAHQAAQPAAPAEQVPPAPLAAAATSGSPSPSFYAGPINSP